MRVDTISLKAYNRIRVAPLAGALGAEVEGIDLRELDDEIIAELQDAWMHYKVLFFRDQDLTPQQHVEYAKIYGPLEVHPIVDSHDDHPEIVVLESTPEKFAAAEVWHSDVTFRECPPLGSVLIGRILPAYGGDTCWANMELAYERLPDDVKEQIEGKYAIHSYVKAFSPQISPERKAEIEEEFPAQKHPIVRTHPVTGRRCLFVNRIFTLTIDGMSAEESRDLRYRLYQQVDAPEIQVRFRWRPNSIAQWDNRCTQHYAVPDHGGQHRLMERATIIGDRPV